MMQEWVNRHGFSDDKALLYYAYALASHYGEAIAELSCQMYEATAEAQGVDVPAAEPSPIPELNEVAKTVFGARKQSEKLVAPAVGRLVKQVGADTTLKNARRDRAEWAWVPMGDTCAFCLTLASRGWQRQRKTDHAEHIHANCDCQYAVRFDGKSGVQGYDPDKYLEMYENAEGSTPHEKINAMRRRQNEEQAYRKIDRGTAKIFQYSKNTTVNTKRVNSYSNQVYISDKAKIKPKALSQINIRTSKALKEWGIEEQPIIVILDSSEMPNVFGKYDAITNTVYYIPEVANKDAIVEVGKLGNIERHEMWHAKQAQTYKKTGKTITPETRGQYIRAACKTAKKNIELYGITEYNVEKISQYAYISYQKGRFDEVEAEYMTLAYKKRGR